MNTITMNTTNTYDKNITIKEPVEGFLDAVRAMADKRNAIDWYDGLIIVNEWAYKLVSIPETIPMDDLIWASSQLLPVLNEPDPQVGGECAMILGKFLEKGLPPDKISYELMMAFQNTLELLNAFFMQVREEIPETEGEMHEEKGGYWIENRFVTPRQAQDFWMQDSRLPQSFASMDNWSNAIATLLSYDKRLLKQVQANHPLVHLIDELNLTSVRMMVHLLEHEPIVVLHPETNQGFIVIIDGITDNFQLHILLADALVVEKKGLLWKIGPNWGIPGKRPSQKVIEVMRGDAPPSIEEPSHGVWDMYQWTAINENRKLQGQPNGNHWIWNEGIPANIPKFEGNRIIILSTSKTERTWDTIRSMPALKAAIEVQKIMKKREVEEWIDHLSRAHK